MVQNLEFLSDFPAAQILPIVTALASWEEGSKRPLLWIWLARALELLELGARHVALLPRISVSSSSGRRRVGGAPRLRHLRASARLIEPSWQPHT